MTLESIVRLQKEYFATDATKDVHFRKECLSRLYESIEDNELAIYDALKKDLGKSKQEVYMTEIEPVLQEIKLLISNLEKWSATKRVLSPLKMFPSSSFVYREPLGVVLIIAPWCNPFLLSLLPLVGALAAGNCVVLKSSRKCEHSYRVIASIVNSTYEKKIAYAIEDSCAYDEITSQSYDFIFFTGSERVAKNIMRKAADRLVPVAVQLGGKNPCIIEESADLELAAKHIIWGKMINAGQTCVAPDYVLVPSKCKEEFIEKCKEYISEFIRDPFSNESYPRIINLHHFMRLSKYLMGEKGLIGGRVSDEQMKIEITLFPDADFSSEVMKEEIFGPLLPIISYTDFDEVVYELKRKPKPLACYIFSADSGFVEDTIESLSFGGCCVNDVMMHLQNERLPYGGVGSGGMGKYHGKASFDLFTNQKSVVKCKGGFESKFRYPPYNDTNFSSVKN